MFVNIASSQVTVFAGSTGDNTGRIGDSAHVREESARFNSKVNLSEVTKVMQNLPENQRNLANKSIALSRRNCKISSMIRIV
jgi:uncharacterized protein (UPF0128 family)